MRFSSEPFRTAAGILLHVESWNRRLLIDGTPDLASLHAVLDRLFRKRPSLMSADAYDEAVADVVDRATLIEAEVVELDSLASPSLSALLSDFKEA